LSWARVEIHDPTQADNEAISRPRTLDSNDAFRTLETAAPASPG
jgi:hypothetical protein